MVDKNSNCVFSGKDVEIPFGYMIFFPMLSGSKNIWCLSLEANLKTLSSSDGQYLGPFDLMVPLKMGDLFRLSF